jgi:hypothetical protein
MLLGVGLGGDDGQIENRIAPFSQAWPILGRRAEQLFLGGFLHFSFFNFVDFNMMSEIRLSTGSWQNSLLFCGATLLGCAEPVYYVGYMT